MFDKVFQATMTIPEKIGNYEIHYEETILKPFGGNKLPLILTDSIGTFSTESNEISIDIGDTVTWSTYPKTGHFVNYL